MRPWYQNRWFYIERPFPWIGVLVGLTYLALAVFAVWAVTALILTIPPP